MKVIKIATLEGINLLILFNKIYIYIKLTHTIRKMTVNIIDINEVNFSKF